MYVRQLYVTAMYLLVDYSYNCVGWRKLDRISLYLIITRVSDDNIAVYILGIMLFMVISAPGCQSR